MFSTFQVFVHNLVIFKYSQNFNFIQIIFRKKKIKKLKKSKTKEKREKSTNLTENPKEVSTKQKSEKTKTKKVFYLQLILLLI